MRADGVAGPGRGGGGAGLRQGPRDPHRLHPRPQRAAARASGWPLARQRATQALTASLSLAEAVARRARRARRTASTARRRGSGCSRRRPAGACRSPAPRRAPRTPSRPARPTTRSPAALPRGGRRRSGRARPRRGTGVALAVPVRVGGQVLGVLEVRCERARERELDWVTALADVGEPARPLPEAAAGRGRPPALRPLRQPHRPAEPLVLPRHARAHAARARGASARAARSSSSTSTASRRSTTASATPPATSCCRRWPSGCGPGRAAPTSWRASAATSSRCWCRTWRAPTTPRSSPAGCSTAWRGPAAPTTTTSRSARAPASASTPRTAPTPTRCCATPTSRCTAPSRRARTPTASSPRR